ncbi:MAG: DUF2240 family protein [Methanomassiliicoccaceae archaeon]|nr:DUF2240 family protein [Methanomassiliicoccaceae archaeon]
MPDELETCLAALFLNKGKDVLTAKEFMMYASLDLRWMQVKDADALMNILLDKGLMSKTGEYLRPMIETSAVNVPVAYRPSEDLLKSLRSYSPKQQTAKGGGAADLLSGLIRVALDSGMEKGAFISECNKISKRTDVDMEVAALMILRERGVDVMPFLDDVRSSVLGR